MPVHQHWIAWFNITQVMFHFIFLYFQFKSFLNSSLCSFSLYECCLCRGVAGKKGFEIIEESCASYMNNWSLMIHYFNHMNWKVLYLKPLAISTHTWIGSKLSVSPLDCIEAFEADSIPWITIYFPCSAPAFLYFSATTSFSLLEIETLSGGTRCLGTLRNGLPSQSTICSYLNQASLYWN